MPCHGQNELRESNTSAMSHVFASSAEVYDLYFVNGCGVAWKLIYQIYYITCSYVRYHRLGEKSFKVRG